MAQNPSLELKLNHSCLNFAFDFIAKLEPSSMVKLHFISGHFF
jgi:hypothetical protein